MAADRTWTLALNTLFLSAATCAISLPLGTVLAWLLVRTDLPGRRAGLLAVGLMLFVPLYLQAAAWQAGFAVQGWWTLGWQTGVWLTGWAGAIWVHAMAALPWVALLVGAGFGLVEAELEEQALLDASAWKVFRKVTLPGAAPGIGLAALWVLIVTAGEMTVTDLFAVRTYAEELYTQFAVAPDLDSPPLAVLPGVLLTGALVLAGLAVCARCVPTARPLSHRPGLLFRLGRWRWPAAILAAAILVLLVGVPVGSLFHKAGIVVSRTDYGYARSWSPAKCLGTILASPVRYQREFGWSVLICALSGGTAAATGCAMAWAAVRSDQRRGNWWRLAPGAILVLLSLCLALPGPILGLGAIWLLNAPGWGVLNYLYDRSILAPWLVLSVRGLPLATLIMWHAFRSVPKELLDCAVLDGAGRLGRFWRVVLPNRLAALGVSWLGAFAVALADLAASILVVPPGMTTLSIRIFDLLHAGVEDRVAGLCLALLALFGATGAAIGWLAKRWRSSDRLHELA